MSVVDANVVQVTIYHEEERIVNVFQNYCHFPSAINPGLGPAKEFIVDSDLSFSDALWDRKGGKLVNLPFPTMHQKKIINAEIWMYNKVYWLH